MIEKSNNLKRPLNPMMEFVKEALQHNNLMESFNQRPAYQKNDYLGWINRAKRVETKEKRLNQMLEELKIGGIYMGMKHSASEKKNSK